MKKSVQYGLIAGAVIAAGVGVTGAAMQQSSAPHPAQHPAASAHRPAPRNHVRGGQRFLSEYDLNHDGKVTRDEFNKAAAQRFAEATGGGKLMNEQQFEAYRTRGLHQHADQTFRRADWNGDGKLSYDEFANPIRASFERADKQSAGVIYCRPQGANSAGSGQAHHGRRGSRGAGNFCSRDDLNHDGKVTRAELDQALHQQFAAAAKGDALNKEQFTGMQHSRAEFTSSRSFQRLDNNHDGKLTLQEFSASQAKTFARMDKNGDGVITRDELTSRRSYANRSSSRT
ncbi:MAG: EF-hand domain-containing protein [Rhizomicrobium sp.]